MATPIRTQVGFSGVDPPDGWPHTRSTPRPERLERALDVLPGIGVTVAKRLAKLGLRTIDDLLRHGPFRYEPAAPELGIGELFGEEEAAIAGVVRRSHKRRTRRVTIVTARVEDETGQIDAVWFNQDWLVDRLKPGTHVRLRGQRRGKDFVVKSYDLGETAQTADFAPVYPASEDVTSKRLRAFVESALPYADDVPDLLPAVLRARLELPIVRDAFVALHRPLSEAEAERARRRLAFDELLELQVGARACAARPGERRGARARRAGGADLALPRGASVHADRAPGARDRRSGPRPGAQRADAAAPAGRRRLREDRRRALRAAARGRTRLPRRADGSDRDARRAALPHDRPDLRRARCARGAAHGPRALRRRGRADHRRHARADPGRRRARRPGRRRRRRAASLRRRAAEGARGRQDAARPAHDRDADPAHARAHAVRRPLGERDLKAARGPQADRHQLDHARPELRGLHAPAPAARRRQAGVRRLPGDRGVGDAAGARGRGGGEAAAPRASSAGSASAASTAA